MPRTAIPLPPKVCVTCGHLYSRNRYGGILEDTAHFKARKYCSLSCANTRLIVTVPRMRIRAHKQIGIACERCGAMHSLHVHHKDENPMNNEPSNLVTWCASCHRRWHWTAGREKSRRASACAICSSPSRRQGFCQKHFRRFRKYGDPRLSKRGNASGTFFVREDTSGRLSRS